MAHSLILTLIDSGTDPARSAGGRNPLYCDLRRDFYTVEDTLTVTSIQQLQIPQDRDLDEVLGDECEALSDASQGTNIHLRDERFPTMDVALRSTETHLHAEVDFLEKWSTGHHNLCLSSTLALISPTTQIGARLIEKQYETFGVRNRLHQFHLTSGQRIHRVAVLFATIICRKLREATLQTHPAPKSIAFETRHEELYEALVAMLTYGVIVSMLKKHDTHRRGRAA